MCLLCVFMSWYGSPLGAPLQSDILQQLNLCLRFGLNLAKPPDICTTNVGRGVNYFGYYWGTLRHFRENIAVTLTALE